MNFLEGSFYLGVMDGENGTLIEDVILNSYSDNKAVNAALIEYRAGVILGSTIKEVDCDTLLGMEFV